MLLGRTRTSPIWRRPISLGAGLMQGSPPRLEWPARVAKWELSLEPWAVLLMCDVSEDLVSSDLMYFWEAMTVMVREDDELDVEMCNSSCRELWAISRTASWRAVSRTASLTAVSRTASLAASSRMARWRKKESSRLGRYINERVHVNIINKVQTPQSQVDTTVTWILKVFQEHVNSKKRTQSPVAGRPSCTAFVSAANLSFVPSWDRKYGTTLQYQVQRGGFLQHT